MRLWSVQPEKVYQTVMESGVYRCDPYQSDMLKPMDYEEKDGIELNRQFGDAYDWLVRQMEKRIGPRPEGVIYPVWAWYLFGGENKLDLRRERWSTGNPGERFACIRLEVPDEEVLLSDFGKWHYVLNRWPISDSEEEADRLDAYLENMSDGDKEMFFSKNWEKIFDTELFQNEWTSQGFDVQATFWELKREYVQGVRYFTAGTKKQKTEDVGRCRELTGGKKIW